MPQCQSADEALSKIQNGSQIFVHGAAATPKELVRALSQRATKLSGLEVFHLHTEGEDPLVDAALKKHLRIRNLFVGANLRPSLNFDSIDYVPCFLSEIPELFRSSHIPIDVALIQVSPPDRHGFCSLGTSVDIAKAAVERASLVIAEVNSQMPRVHGDGHLPFDRVDFWIETNNPLPESASHSLSEVEKKIGENVASLIEDGSTLQVGIGAIPDAVLAQLKNRKNLGLHSEMWSDGALDLIQCGAIDNSRKAVHPGKSVATFLIGTKRLYDFVNDNPSVALLEADYVNSTTVIARNPKVVAINSAVEIDLSGQVCADSIGPKVISGVGGQMDFIRGAALSKGGKPIIAMPSRTKHGAPRIVSFLKRGAGVVTTRAHVHFVVTEFGIADLVGKSLGERAKLLIEMAHPADREALEAAWRSGI